MILIVGLGNPGQRYTETRHNIGFEVVDAFAAQVGAAAFRDKFQGQFSLAEWQGKSLGLLKPQTFMNLSGKSVLPAFAFYKPELIVVAHDELDLPFGDVKLKVGGGDAGHRGLRSIIEHLGRDFARLRLGIGRPPPQFRGAVADFVLQPFSSEERSQLSELVVRSVGALSRVVTDGLSAAMNFVNQRAKP